MAKIVIISFVAALAACAGKPELQLPAQMNQTSGTRVQSVTVRMPAPTATYQDEPVASSQRLQRVVVTETPGSLLQIINLQKYRGGERLLYQVIDLPGTPSEAVKMETHVVVAGTTAEVGYSTLSTDGNTFRRYNQLGNLLAYRDYNGNTMSVTPARSIVPPLPIRLDAPSADLQPFSFPLRNFPNFSLNFVPTVTGRESVRLCIGDKCYETIRITVLLTDRAALQIHHETVWLAEGLGVVMWRFRSTFARNIEADRILLSCDRDGSVC